MNSIKTTSILCIVIVVMMGVVIFALRDRLLPSAEPAAEK